MREDYSIRAVNRRNRPFHCATGEAPFIAVSSRRAGYALPVRTQRKFDDTVTYRSGGRDTLPVRYGTQRFSRHHNNARIADMVPGSIALEVITYALSIRDFDIVVNNGATNSAVCSNDAVVEDN